MADLSNLPDDHLLGLADIAEALDLSAASVRTYHTDANRRRRQGKPLPQDLPAPDVTIGRTPGWKVSTIEVWIAAREAAGQRNLARLRQPRGSRSKEEVTA